MILDNIEDLQITDTSSATAQNALKTIAYLWSGLEFLNLQVSSIEQSLSEQLQLETRRVFMVGNAPALKNVPQGLIACAFHWYATSACNLVRLIGWLCLEHNPRKADAYVGRVVPNMRVWRNKVAAHFAITDPRAEDTAAILESCVMFPIGFDDGLFVTQPLTMAMRRSGIPSKTRGDMYWSLTKVHEQLASRYMREKQK